ncbi:MAG: bifunctional nuclease family protein [Candidatus Omnitrophica bacterium]|nr:bifunctional nuclease family protein [Candidatus Omnitrophota bacterium]MBU2044770.1 bifunctional nuclease family protein [Candidatus Omnitrophota bacterium]MBU2265816.1 bifunctional nuclease family protein [Candidatus Omnitrophota bacterium]MBU2473986.1 bifunctional nuclease family protein [Candidatus Omnitrophota bacterium]
MIELELSRIIIDEEKKEQVVVLKEKNGSRLMPIVIGMSEASAIKMKLNGFKPPRPLTHDLISAILNNLGANLEKVVIDNLIEGTFHAKLYLSNNGDLAKIVDARPSDSIALAVRTQSPIFVEDKVLEKLAQSS